MEGSDYWVNRSADDERKDWKDNTDWITGYWNSKNHPHRKLIIDAIKEIGGVGSVIEVGCNCGPNLSVIKETYPDIKISGVDLNADAIIKGRRMLGLGRNLKVANVEDMPFDDDEFDVCLADAVLMYVGPDKIDDAINEMVRVSKKGIIILDWYDEESNSGVVKNHHWTRNYKKLLENKGLEVRKEKITEDLWPNKSWMDLGYLFVAKYLPV